MVDSTQLISIGMPVYNNGATIKMAIESIINQSYCQWELLIMDDGSTDNSLKIANEFKDLRIKIISDGVNRGLAYRMNQAIELSRGNYFARMDADDIAYPARLLRQVSYLLNNKWLDLVGTGCIIFNSSLIPTGMRIYPEAHQEICRRPWNGIQMMHPTWMGKTSWFRKYKYNIDMKKAQDLELLLRTYNESLFGNIPEILMGYREDHANLKKTLISRIHAIRAYKKSAEKFVSFEGIVVQMLKIIIDFISHFTGFREQVIEERSKRTTDDADYNWQQLLESIRYQYRN